MILTDKGLQTLVDSQFKVGADAGVSFATYGTGVSGSTTATFKGDIVAFARSRGLFAGLSVDGSLIEVRSEWNALYYGKPMAAQQLVLQGEGQQPRGGAAARDAGPVFHPVTEATTKPGRFWEEKSLDEMSQAEWESLCERLRPLLPAQIAARG